MRETKTWLRLKNYRKNANIILHGNNITTCEAKIIKEMNWNMLLQTPLHFVKLFYCTGVIFSSDMYNDDINHKTIELKSEKSRDHSTISELLRTVKHY